MGAVSRRARPERKYGPEIRACGRELCFGEYAYESCARASCVFQEAHRCFCTITAPHCFWQLGSEANALGFTFGAGLCMSTSMVTQIMSGGEILASMPNFLSCQERVKLA